MVLKIEDALQPVNVQSVLTPTSRVEHESSFSNTLKDAIAKVNNEQIDADKKTEMLVEGKDIDLHEVMMAAQKASITLETTVQVQKKVMDAYNEVMRMQI